MTAELTLFTATPPRRAVKRPKPQVDPAAGAEYGHWVDDDGRHGWQLRFAAPAPLMSVNTNKHWRVTSPVKKTWREAMFLHAKAAKLPTGLARVRVDVDLRFPTAARHDAANYHAFVVKPCVDALGPARQYVIRKGKRAGTVVNEVGYGLIPDDTAQYLDGPYPSIGTKVADPRRHPYGEVIVTITDLSGQVTA